MELRARGRSELVNDVNVYYASIGSKINDKSKVG